MTGVAELLNQAEAAVSAAQDLAALDGVRVQFLGKKGVFTAQLRELGKLPPDQIRAAGAAINTANPCHTRMDRAPVDGGGSAAGLSASGVVSIRRKASPMSRSRRRGSDSSVACRSGRTAAGTRERSGAFVTTAASVSTTVSPANSGLPVTISYSTTPNAQMSARLSTLRPLACSGAM